MLDAVLKKKKIIIGAVVLLLGALAAGVVLHVNPEADHQYEIIKKSISVCIIICMAVLLPPEYVG